MSSIDVVIPARDPTYSLLRNIEAWLSQELPSPWRFRIYLVDDGSSNEVPSKAAKKYDGLISLVQHAAPLGRSAARNSGSDAGRGDFIAFFDADCFPASRDVLMHFVRALSTGADVAFGRLESIGDSFWSRYVNHVSRRRERMFLEGNYYALTTASCILSRDLFVSVGKFDTRYRKYGFEDRDLAVRLMAHGARLVFVPRAIVLHDDSLNLVDVGRKLRTAGRYTSGLFMNDHPKAYEALSFKTVDVRCCGALVRAVATVTKPVLDVLLRLGDRALNLPLPFRFKAAIARLFSGLAFSVGTLESEHEGR